MNIYIIRINSKYFNRLLRYHINIIKIIKKDNYYILYLDKVDYEKINKYKKIYEIEFLGYKGFIKYKKIFFHNIIFFIIFFISIIYIFLLSNIIFDIEVKTTNNEIKELVLRELKNYNIDYFKFVKSFSEKEKIKKKILDDNKDKLEWMEITRKGSKYIINVEERIIKNINEDNSPQDIVALKNAIILSIDAKTGSIVKKLNDYVKRGDIIVTGSITHKDNIVNLVHADAVIFGETWYNVHVSYPFSYYEKIYTPNKIKRINISFFNKKIDIGKKYRNEEINEKKLLYHKFLPISFNIYEVSEIALIDDLLTIDEAYEQGLIIAREKLLKSLPKDSKILEQKKLKIIVNNNTIDVDIFFKVYENITDIRKINEG